MTTASISVDYSTTGRIDYSGERDYFQTYLYSNRVYAIEMKGASSSNGSLADPRIDGVSYSGRTVYGTSNDDFNGSLDSFVFFVPDATGYHTINVSSGRSSGTGSYKLSLTEIGQAGTNGDDTIIGTNFSEVIYGYGGNDILHGENGDDFLYGDTGVDTAYYHYNYSNFTVRKNSTGYTVSGYEGSDTLDGIERIRFEDRVIAVDIDGNAGDVYRLYQAAFDRRPDNGGLKYWIGRADTGTSLENIAAGFVNSAEFRSLYGSNPTIGEYIDQLYWNVLHRAPDRSGFNWWVDEMYYNNRSMENVLARFADSPENQVGVIGVIQNGITLY